MPTIEPTPLRRYAHTPPRFFPNRLRFSSLAKESVIEGFSCSIVMLQSGNETYLAHTSCTRNYPAIDGRTEASRDPKEGSCPYGGTDKLQR
jgi:hypothetical protein